MGSIFTRGSRLWLRYKTASGKWVNRAAHLGVGQERKARVLLKKTEDRIAATIEAGGTDSDPLTVARYCARWIERRETTNKADDEARLRLHALPLLGRMKLVDVRPRDVKSLVDHLVGRMKKQELAPRTVRHIYGTLHTMFEQAREDELIEANPCALKKGYLPKKRDKDPTFRPLAKFTHEEVERFLSDPRIPEDRHVVYALLALTGMRFGELAAVQWLHYDNHLQPLGRILVAQSYDFKHKRVKGTKTERPREIPVHPTLAKMLAEWKLAGWQRLMGRAPKPEDLIVPASKQDLVHGLFRNPNEERKFFYKDVCDRLEVRRRRIHDFRRTFVSLARDDGAARDVIRWVTHPPDGDILDAYTTPAWSLLCQEVAKLKIRVREADNVVELRAAAGADDSPEPPPDSPTRPRRAHHARTILRPAALDGSCRRLVTGLVTAPSTTNEKGLKSSGPEASSQGSGRRDLKTNMAD
jgi:integrase